MSGFVALWSVPGTSAQAFSHMTLHEWATSPNEHFIVCLSTNGIDEQQDHYFCYAVREYAGLWSELIWFYYTQNLTPPSSIICCKTHHIHFLSHNQQIADLECDIISVQNLHNKRTTNVLYMTGVSQKYTSVEIRTLSWITQIMVWVFLFWFFWKGLSDGYGYKLTCKA